MIEIHGDGWFASILSGPPEDGIFNVFCTTVGNTHAEAMMGATAVLNIFAHGRWAFIRVKPEAVSEEDFDTKITHHRGFVRFSYKLESGEWHYPNSDDERAKL